MPEDEEGQRNQPRPFWSGTIAFGLVNMPVRLFLAHRANAVNLRLMDETGTPLSRRYFCPQEARAVSREEIVRGYEAEPNRFVAVSDEELAALAPEKSEEIDLRRFVALSEIEPIYFERAYFLAPGKGAIKAYRLLAQTMEAAGRAGIATFVMRGKEYWVAIIAENRILRAETMRFHEELRSPADVGLPEPETADSARLHSVREAMQALTTDTFDRQELSDRQSRRILDRVHEKLAAGKDVIEAPSTQEAEEEPAEPEQDLMEVLKQSLQQKPTGQARQQPRRRRGEGTTDARRRSKADLYAQAKELGIAGRSQMSKKQLVEAIANAR